MVYEWSQVRLGGEGVPQVGLECVRGGTGRTLWFVCMGGGSQVGLDGLGDYM